MDQKWLTPFDKEALTAPTDRNRSVKVMACVWVYSNHINIYSQGRRKRRIGQMKKTHDSGGLCLVELLLKAGDAQRYAEKVDCVASPSKPSNERVAKLSSDKEIGGNDSNPDANCAHWIHVMERNASRRGRLLPLRASRRGMRLRMK